MSARAVLHAPPAPAAHEGAALSRPSWTVAPPNSAEELEATRLSERAVTGGDFFPVSVNGTGSAIHREPADENEQFDDEGEELQRAPISSGVPAVTPQIASNISAERASGQGLPTAERSFYEGRLGHNLSGVRIHSGPRAARAAHGLQARAFTMGQHVFLGGGAPSGDTAAGQRLRAHELVHTIQNRPASIARFEEAAPLEPAGAESKQSVDAAATRIQHLVESDPSGSSGELRQYLSSLDPVIRGRAMAVARGRLPVGLRAALTNGLAPPSGDDPQQTQAAPSAASDATRAQPRPSVPTPATPPAPASPAVATPAAATPVAAAPAPGAQQPAIAATGAKAQAQVGAQAEGVAQITGNETAAVQQDAATAEANAAPQDNSTALPSLAQVLEPVPAAPTSQAANPAGAPAAAEAAGGSNAVAEPSQEDESPDVDSGPQVDTEELADEIAEGAEDARAQLQSAADRKRAMLRAKAGSARAGVRSQVEKAHAAVTTAISTERTLITKACAATRRQIQTELIGRRAEAATRNKTAQTDMTGVFTSHRKNVETTVADKIKESNTISTDGQDQATRRTAQQVQSARDSGRAKAATYPYDERGRTQASAVRGVADGVAEEIQGNLPETLANIREKTAEIPEQFALKGAQALQGFDQNLPELIAGVSGQVQQVLSALDGDSNLAQFNVGVAEASWQERLTALESSAHARIDSVTPQVASQIDAALGAALRGVGQAAAQGSSGIDQIAGEGSEILLRTENPDPDKSQAFVDGVLQYIYGISDEDASAIDEAATGVASQIQRAVPVAAQSTAAALQELATIIQKNAASRSEALLRAETQFDQECEHVLAAGDSAYKESRDRIAAQLAPAVDRLRIDFDKTLTKARSDVREKVDEGLDKNEEGLADLYEGMLDAASDAGWDFDHPVLAGIRDYLEIVAGIVIGIAAVLVLIFVIIPLAIEVVAAIAGIFLEAATAALVAKILVGLTLGGLAAYGAYSAYQARIAAKDENPISGTLQDLLGITEIKAAFTNRRLSPFERGFSFGKGAATLVTSVLGIRGLLKRFGGSRPPTLPNPEAVRPVAVPRAPAPVVEPVAPRAAAPAAPVIEPVQPATPAPVTEPLPSQPSVQPPAPGPTPITAGPAPSTPSVAQPAAPAPVGAEPPAASPPLRVIQGGGSGARPAAAQPPTVRAPSINGAANDNGLSPRLATPPRRFGVFNGEGIPGERPATPPELTVHRGGGVGRAPAPPVEPIAKPAARPVAVQQAGGMGRRTPQFEPQPVDVAPNGSGAAGNRPPQIVASAPRGSGGGGRGPVEPPTARPAASPARPASSAPSGGGGRGGGGRGGGSSAPRSPRGSLRSVPDPVPESAPPRPAGQAARPSAAETPAEQAPRTGKGKGTGRPAKPAAAETPAEPAPRTGKGGRGAGKGNRLLPEGEVDAALEDGFKRPNATGGKRPRIDGDRVPSRSGKNRKSLTTKKVLDIQDIRRAPGETQRQALQRVQKIVGRDLTDFPDLVEKWNKAAERATRKEPLTELKARSLYERVLRSFYRAVEGTPSQAKFNDAGLQLPGDGGSPVFDVYRPRRFSIRDLRLSMDHKTEIRLDWTKAIDPRNFRFEFARPNSRREIIQLRHPRLLR